MQNTEQPREITPQEWLTPPVNYQLKPPAHVLDANAQAANMMNKAKIIFVGQCLAAIVPKEDLGEVELAHLGDTSAQATALLEKIDHSKIKMTLRPLYDQPLLRPEDAHLAKDKAIIRQYGTDIEFAYDRRVIGILNFRFNTGEIQITATVDTEPS